MVLVVDRRVPSHRCLQAPIPRAWEHVPFHCKMDSEVAIKLETRRWGGDPGGSERPHIITKVLIKKVKVDKRCGSGTRGWSDATMSQRM